MSDDVIKRDEKGHFLPGCPPGPGRPKGITRAEAAAAFLEPHAQQALTKALEFALAGDAQHMKLILERVCPVPRAEAERVVVPGLAEAASVSDKARAVVNAVASGAITAESGRSVLQMLDLLSRAVKLDDLERRMQAIEQGKKQRVINPDPDDCADIT
jgi:hypothetical protein